MCIRDRDKNVIFTERGTEFLRNGFHDKIIVSCRCQERCAETNGGKMVRIGENILFCLLYTS